MTSNLTPDGSESSKMGSVEQVDKEYERFCRVSAAVNGIDGRSACEKHIRANSVHALCVEARPKGGARAEKEIGEKAQKIVRYQIV